VNGQVESQERIALELIDTLDEVQRGRFVDPELIQKAKELNVRLTPTYQRLYGAVPQITSSYPSYIWWPRAREHASQALAHIRAIAADREIDHPDPLASRTTNAVFIVHGHDHGLKEAVARLITQLGYRPIVLNDESNRGRTIIEKLEAEGDAAAFAVVLLTPDDEGRRRGDAELQARARQNVLFEFGYFLAALSRLRVVALLTDPEIDRPSDVDGLLYVPVRSVEDRAWRLDLAVEMRGAGLDVDLNRLAES
jgi:predicted nucleotide-binding protein